LLVLVNATPCCRYRNQRPRLPSPSGTPWSRATQRPRSLRVHIWNAPRPEKVHHLPGKGMAPPVGGGRKSARSPPVRGCLPAARRPSVPKASPPMGGSAVMRWVLGSGLRFWRLVVALALGLAVFGIAQLRSAPVD